MRENWLWRTIVVAAIGVMISMWGWTMNSVANMPKEYTSKGDFDSLRKENREDHQRILDAIIEMKEK